MSEKELCSNEEKLKEEIKIIIERIRSSIEEYRKKLYTPTPEKIKAEILSNLISAQKALSMYEFLIECNNSTFDVAKKEIKFKFVANQISHATRLTKKYYNNEVAKEVDKILGSFIKKIEYIKKKENFKYLPGIKYIRDLGKTIILDYVKEEIEIPDEAYNLIEFYKDTEGDYWGYKALKVYEIVGIKEVLLKFETIIDTRVQQYNPIEINILLDFIESEIDFDEILVRVNAE